MPHENNPNNPYSISENNEVREDNTCLVKVRSPESGQILELAPVKVWVLAPRSRKGVKIGLFKDPTTGKYFSIKLPDDYPEYCIQRINKKYEESETIQGVEAEEELEVRDLLKSLEEDLNVTIEIAKKYMEFSKKVKSRYPENPYAWLVGRFVLYEWVARALTVSVMSLSILIKYLAVKLGIRDDAFSKVLAKLMEVIIATEELSKPVEDNTITSSLSQLLRELERRGMGNG